MKRKNLALALFVSAFIVAILGGGYAYFALFGPSVGEVPMTSAPSASSTPMPSPVTPSSSESPSPTPTPVKTTPLMANIDGIPVHIEVRHGADTLVNASIVPITLQEDGRLVPPAGQAGVYYSQTEWATIPGDLDAYSGVIAAHDVTGFGTPDVFALLGQAKQGDVVILTYQLNAGGQATAEFVITADAVSVLKTDIAAVLQPAATPGRYLTVLTCDAAARQPGQHSKNNWVVYATRTK